jgi:dipicolinate synthase subunit A
MNKSLRFNIIGGDARQIYLARLLKKDGHNVALYGIDPELCPEVDTSNEFPSLLESDCVVLPLPAFADDELINAPLFDKPLPIAELKASLCPGQLVVAGFLPASFFEWSDKNGVHTTDYFVREEMAILNAIPAVEGAIALAMEETPITMHGANVLVIGFGKIGKILAHRLHALGSRVTVSARKYSDFAWMDAYGYAKANTNLLGSNLGQFDIIFNTVPATVLTRERLAQLKHDCLVIDIASKPGGVDFAAAKELGTNVIWALSLPGKCSPLTSGRIIRDIIYHILEEKGILHRGEAGITGRF